MGPSYGTAEEGPRSSHAHTDFYGVVNSWFRSLVVEKTRTQKTKKDHLATNDT